MTSVEKKKIPQIIEELREKFKASLGKDVSDEEIIEKCLKFSMQHVNELISEKQEKKRYFENMLSEGSQDKQALSTLMSGILEEEYEKIKQSGKTIKQVIRESWKY
ncbi:MAG: hypothetical protein GF364_06385 [Candidatus Lokiarchaeota archaeon]|nr:hypothetical protein [Candidatus Lokiarchaeota archaeon]